MCVFETQQRTTMKPVRIFRHIDCEGPGYLAAYLERRRVPYELVRIDQGEAVPARIDDVSGLVFMGGSMSVNDDLPWIDDELALIRHATAQQLPILGHCLGGQLIAKALGGVVSRNAVKEIGWLPVAALEAPAATDWLSGLPPRFEVFHWHGETFSIPARAQRILRSAFCANQGFVMDNILALQFHLEMTPELVRQWTEAYSPELAVPSASVQDAAQVARDLDQRITALARVADVLYNRWLRPIAA